jgi:hypothetical protein
MTILATSAIANTKVKIRYQEPYVSAAFNKALHVLAVNGIEDGFLLRAAGGKVVRLQVDGETGLSTALVRTTGGHTVAVEETGNINLDLSAYTGQTVYLYLFVDYTNSSATSAEYRVVDAAELVNPWVAGAVRLGVVRVPSVGSIGTKHLSQGSAHISGLSKGTTGAWSLINANQDLLTGHDGFELVVNAAGATYGRSVNGLTFSGTLVAGGEAGLLMPLRNVNAGDRIHVRLNHKTVGTPSAGAQLVVSFDGVDVVINDNEPLAAFTEFGYTYEVPAGPVPERFDLRVQGKGGAGVTIAYELQALRVYVKPGKSSGEKQVQPLISAVQAIHFVDPDSADPEPDAQGIAALPGQNGLQFVGFNILNGSVPIFGDFGVTSTTLENCMIADSLAGARAATVMGATQGITSEDGLWGFGVVGGLTPSILSANTVRIATGALKNPRSSKILVFSSNTDVNVDIAGGLPTAFVVYANQSEAIVAGTVTAFQNTNGAIPLAYGSFNGAAIDYIIDLRELPKDGRSAIPLVVGRYTGRHHSAYRTPQFDSFEKALEVARILATPYRANNGELLVERASVVIEIQDGYTLLPPSSAPFSAQKGYLIPPGVTVRGQGRKPVVTISNTFNATAKIFTFAASGTDSAPYKFENLTFLLPSSFSGRDIFRASGVSDISLCDVDISTSDANSPRRGIYLTNCSRVLIENCKIKGLQSIELDSCNAIEMLNSKFESREINPLNPAISIVDSFDITINNSVFKMGDSISPGFSALNFLFVNAENLNITNSRFFDSYLNIQGSCVDVSITGCHIVQGRFANNGRNDKIAVFSGVRGLAITGTCFEAQIGVDLGSTYLVDIFNCELAMSGCTFRHTKASCLRIENTSLDGLGVVSGCIFNNKNGAGVNNVGVKLHGTGLQLLGCSTNGYTNNVAALLTAASKDCIVNSFVVNQAGAGVGYTNLGTDNVFDNIKVI